MVNEAKERGEGTIMVDTNLTYPGWLRILITAIITAVCTAGVLAAILVWQLTPPPPPPPPSSSTSPSPPSSSSSSTSSSPSSSSSGLPSPAAQSVADDAGGEGSAPLNQENPFRPPPPSESEEGDFHRSALAVDSKPCSVVGRKILQQKGTAVDAAIGVLFCNGVVTSQSMGIGGGFIMTVHLANGTALSLVARETAPAASSRDMFRNSSSVLGAKAGGVPGEVRGYWEAKQRLGNPSISWAELVQPAIDLCEGGITVTAHAANAMRKSQARIVTDPGLRSVFIDERTGQVYKEGDVYRHPVLAATLRRIAEHGAEEFYSGETASKLVRDLEEAGGLMTLSDLKNYSVSWETPVRAVLPHTDLTLLSSPPPASGSIVAAILGLAGLKKPRPADLHRPQTWQTFIEASKFAFAKRSLLGDGARDEELGSSVRSLVEQLTNTTGWWDDTAARISELSTSQDPAWYGAQFCSVEDSGTTHISILDPEGNAVSVTSTINTLYGAKFMSRATGIILNNQMDDFSYPGIVNTYGVRPSEANMVAPGKRPVSSMSPSILVDSSNRVIAVVGASGGTKIITAVAQVLYRMVYMAQSVKQAVDARRLHHQLIPMEILYEDGVTQWMVDGLQKIGHQTRKFSLGGSIVQAILVDRQTGAITANADFRKQGTVDGF